MIDDPKKNEPPRKDQGPSGAKAGTAKGQDEAERDGVGAAAAAGLPEEKAREGAKPDTTAPVSSSTGAPSEPAAASRPAAPRDVGASPAGVSAPPGEPVKPVAIPGARPEPPRAEATKADAAKPDAVKPVGPGSAAGSTMASGVSEGVAPPDRPWQSTGAAGTGAAAGPAAATTGPGRPDATKSTAAADKVAAPGKPWQSSSEAGMTTPAKPAGADKQADPTLSSAAAAAAGKAASGAAAATAAGRTTSGPSAPLTAPGTTKKPEADKAAAAASAAGTVPPRPGGPAGSGGGAGAIPPSQRRRGHGCLTSALWGLVMLAALAVIGYLTWPYWSPYAEAYFPTPRQDQQILALEDRIGQLEQTIRQSAPQQDALASLRQEGQALRTQMSTLLNRLEQVEAAPPPAAVQPGPDLQDADADEIRREVGRLRAVIDQAQSDIAAAQAAAAAAQSSAAQVSQLQQKVGELEQRETAQRETQAAGAGAAATALALNGLSQAVDTADPYAGELEAFQAAAGDTVAQDQSLEVLKQHADSGVPTLGDLYQGFSAMADAVERASTELTGEGAWETTYNRLRSLVSIRRTGEAALDAGGVDATLALTQDRLQAGDLNGAVDAISNLDGAAAAAAQPWLAGAQARLAVDDAMSQLRIRAITALSSKEG